MNDWTGFLGGHPQAVTPNMDALANRGVNFTNAHCPAPGCSPSRNAVLFGVEPNKSGLYVFYDLDSIPEETLKPYTALTEFFMANGYETFGSGKIHHKRDTDNGEWSEFFKRDNQALKFDKNEDEYYTQGNWKMTFGPTLSPYEKNTDYQNTTYGVEVLDRAHEKPFFLAVGIIKPHLPFVAPKPFFDLYQNPVEPPVMFENDIDDIPEVGRCMIKQGDNARFIKDHAWDRVRRAYLACISWADYNVGRLIEALEASEYADNTIVVLWSDHGYALQEKGHFRKFALWEETTRVPFIIWDTREHQAGEGREIADGVSLINIYRTLAELSGLTPPKYVDGYSLAPYLEDTRRRLPTPAVTNWGRGNYSVRDADWRYIRYYDGSEELYSHLKDANEWSNLADQREYAEVKRRLSAFIPTDEAPLIKEGAAAWSMPISADKAL